MNTEQLEAEIRLMAQYGAALEGIASCATQCSCCRMHVSVALKALGRPQLDEISPTARALIDRQCEACE